MLQCIQLGYRSFFDQASPLDDIWNRNHLDQRLSSEMIFLLPNRVELVANSRNFYLVLSQELRNPQF